jgi:hypothetical protein
MPIVPDHSRSLNENAEVDQVVELRAANEPEATNEAAWYSRWDEAEEHYLAHVRPPESYDSRPHGPRFTI